MVFLSSPVLVPCLTTTPQGLFKLCYLRLYFEMPDIELGMQNIIFLKKIAALWPALGNLSTIILSQLGLDL